MCVCVLLLFLFCLFSCFCLSICFHLPSFSLTNHLHQQQQHHQQHHQQQQRQQSLTTKDARTSLASETESLWFQRNLSRFILFVLNLLTSFLFLLLSLIFSLISLSFSLSLFLSLSLSQSAKVTTVPCEEIKLVPDKPDGYAAGDTAEVKEREKREREREEREREERERECVCVCSFYIVC